MALGQPRTGLRGGCFDSKKWGRSQTGWMIGGTIHTPVLAKASQYNDPLCIIIATI